MRSTLKGIQSVQSRFSEVAGAVTHASADLDKLSLVELQELGREVQRLTGELKEEAHSVIAEHRDRLVAVMAKAHCQFKGSGTRGDINEVFAFVTKEYGAFAPELLSEALLHGDEEIGELAIQTLKRFGEAAFQPLLKGALRCRELNGMLAASVIEKLKGRAPTDQEIKLMIERVCLPNRWAESGRRLISWALPRSAGPLCVAFRKAADYEKVEIAKAFGLAGERAADMVPDLVVALRDRNPRVRSAAVGALGQIGVATPVVDELVRVLLKDPEPSVRYNAASSLMALKEFSEAVTDAIGKAVFDSDEQVGALCLGILLKFGQASYVLPQLRSVLAWPPLWVEKLRHISRIEERMKSLEKEISD